MSQDTNASHPDVRPSGSGSSNSDDTAPVNAESSLRIHTCARDLLAWLLPALGRFPREQRHTVQQHMADLAMRVLDQTIAARHLPGGLRAQALRDADVALDQLRQYAHIALLQKWWSPGQYAHFSGLTSELGRLLGGWRRRMASPNGRVP